MSTRFDSFEARHIQPGSLRRAFCISRKMEKHDIAEMAKVNIPPAVAYLSASAWHLDDWVKVVTIIAMVVSIFYTCFKIYRLWKHPKALDTVRGHDD